MPYIEDIVARAASNSFFREVVSTGTAQPGRGHEHPRRW